MSARLEVFATPGTARILDLVRKGLTDAQVAHQVRCSAAHVRDLRESYAVTGVAIVETPLDPALFAAVRALGGDIGEVCALLIAERIAQLSRGVPA